MSNKFFHQIGKHFGEGVGAVIGGFVGGPQGAVKGAQLGRNIQQTIQGDSAPVNNDRTNAKEDPNYAPHKSSNFFESTLGSVSGGGAYDKKNYGSNYYNPDGSKKAGSDQSDWSEYVSIAAQSAQLFAA